MARATGLEPAASGVTGRRSNQLSYARAFLCLIERSVIRQSGSIRQRRRCTTRGVWCQQMVGGVGISAVKGAETARRLATVVSSA